MTRPSEDHPDLRLAKINLLLTDSAMHSLRWYVHRITVAPEFPLVGPPTTSWAVTPIKGGRGSHGIPLGNPVPLGDRAVALELAHRLATHTYRPGKARP
jgi:hypothetical protein